MKKQTLRKHLIIWYSVFFALLILLNIFIVFLLGEPLTVNRAENEIKEVAEDVAETLTVVSGIAYYDYEDNERFIYYEDGIAFVLYVEGLFFEGQYPANIPNDFPLQPYTIQRYNGDTAVWYIYDLPLQNGFTLRAFYNDRGGIEAYGEFLNILLIIAPVILLASTIGGLFIIKNALKPVTEMANVAKKIKQEENFQLRLNPPHTNDEIDTLALTINEMLDKVEKSLQREKSFSSNVSHELRTPLTVLKAQCEYLESKIKDTKYTQDFKQIHLQIDSLEKIITQMLDLTRLSSETVIKKETFTISEVMNSIIQGFEEMNKAKNISINLIIEPETLQIKTAQTFFIRIMNNLINNAIKFSHHDSEITIHIMQKKEGIECFIKDEGIGISKSHLPYIFDALYQVESSRNDHPLSIGVGLSMVKEMISLLGGKISVESEEFKGTTFILFFPQ